MTDGLLNADIEQYRQAAAANTPPPRIVSDPAVLGVTPVEQWIAVLVAAANLSDAADNARSAEEHAEREAKLLDAAEKFAAQDDQAAADLNSIAAEPYPAAGGTAAAEEPSTAAAQQFPQMVSGIAGALAGAVGGALQPLAQLPQQAAQGVQQAIQAMTGSLQQVGAETVLPPGETDLAASPLAGDFGVADIGDLGPGASDVPDVGGGEFGAGLGGGWGALGGTAPTGQLGPPPTPSSSASTAPSAAPITSIGGPATTASHPPGGTGMAGMPLVPPGALGAANSTDKDGKADTKRVSVPPVRNGAPVQGRLGGATGIPPMTAKVDGTPVVTRLIVGPEAGQPADTKPGS